MNPFRPALIAALSLVCASAHATSFDCSKGRSPTEQMICRDPALSALDDTLGQLYWKVQRRVTDRRAFILDSDGKWAWREAHCRDAICLREWYATRIDELRRASVGEDRWAVMKQEARQDAGTLQCTAAEPGIAIAEQCATVIKGGSPWPYNTHGADWFCGFATLPAAAA